VTNEYVVDGHLGGYVKGGDAATYYPGLWTWLVKGYGVQSVLDIGCGEGHALDYFLKLDCHALGVDGVPQDHPRIITHDYVTNGELTFDREFDLCWCCEFVEHVEEQYMLNYLQSFTYCSMVLLTHALPGQQGHHHVNCRTSDYWRGAMAATGFEYDVDFTDACRKLAAQNEHPLNHFRDRGLVFVRNYYTNE